MSSSNLIGTHVVSSLQELESLAKLLAGQLRIGDIVCLQGDLGAGKTTFVQYIAKALGISDHVTSPTYTLLAEYDVQNNPRDISKLIHIDAYRKSMDTNYVHEIVRTAEEQKAVIVIEWPERLGLKIADPFWGIAIASGDTPDGRIVTVVR